MAINIKRLEKSDIKDFKILFEKTKAVSVYSPFNGHSMDEFEWSFFSDDCEKAVYITATDDNNDELLGTQAGMIIPMITPDGKICQTIKGEDTLVNIEGMISYRRRDLLKEMYERIDEHSKHLNILFYWGFSNIGAAKAHKRIGYSTDHMSQQGLLVIHPMKSYNHLKSLNKANGIKQKLQILALSFLSLIKALPISNVKGIDCEEILIKQIDEDKILSFLPKGLFSIHLSKAFLKWRIGTNPSKLKYSILQFKSKNEVVSYMIYSIKEGSIVFIEQFLFDDKLSSAQKKEIVKLAMFYFKSKKFTIVRAMGFDHNTTNKDELNVLKDAGFIFIKKGLGFIMKSNNEAIKSEKIYLSRLNTQGIY